jgi:hypothetical protein
MTLDLRRDFDDVYAFVLNRIHGFDPSANNGPGKPGPVRQIDLGFEYYPSGWVAVVFDTRPDAEPDGEWNSYIEGNELARAHWQEAGEANLDGPITLVQLDGTETVFPAGAELAEPLGELLKLVLLKVRADGVFEKLPKAAGCELSVEHHEGAYGWPVYEKRGKKNLA